MREEKICEFLQKMEGDMKEAIYNAYHAGTHREKMEVHRCNLNGYARKIYKEMKRMGLNYVPFKYSFKFRIVNLASEFDIPVYPRTTERYITSDVYLSIEGRDIEKVLVKVKSWDEKEEKEEETIDQALKRVKEEAEKSLKNIGEAKA